MLLINPNELSRRRSELDRWPELRDLATRIEDLAHPLVRDPLYFPERKSLLSRDGGSCEHDGARLVFDPSSPDCHSCPNCGAVFQGELHHRAWIWHYHLWLSERAIHLALLGALRGDATLTEKAAQIIGLYVERYRDFPNRDNVLGPARLFFSTYLESIWLIQLTIAASLLKTNKGATATLGLNWEAFDSVVQESAGLIASYDEGWSNRQVWNNTAMVAAGLWLSRPDGRGPLSQPLVVMGLNGPHGLRAQLVTAVGNEGLWFEGENYHFFALRGFLLAAELLRSVGIDLYGADAPAARLSDMFVAPLHTVLPDLTLPARGDSPYGVSLLQPRFAELWEIGWARTGDERLESLLSHLYSAAAPDDDGPGMNEIAEQEQNRPARAMSRQLLGWKALCWMRSTLPDAGTELWRSGSALLPGAGVAVMRTEPDRYISVECGGGHGGHGHPDLLHLTLYWNKPLLMDFGTASYVTPSLHWYRSTLAHNAPGVAGRGQLGVSAWCAAFDTSGPWTWCRAAAEVLGDGTLATRTVVVGPACVIDTLEIAADENIVVDLPIHPVSQLRFAVAGPGASGDWEETDVVGVGKASNIVVADNLTWDTADLSLLLGERAEEQLYLVERPGPPDDQFADGEPLTFLLRRARGPGIWQQYYLLGADRAVGVRRQKRDIELRYSDGTRDRITIGKDGCRIIGRAGDKHKLTGLRERPEPPITSKVRQTRILCLRLDHCPDVAEWERHLAERAVIELGKKHYRRSEEHYGARGGFGASVAVFTTGSTVCFAAHVHKKQLHLRPRDAVDPALDNESPDIHSDGIQCYVAMGQWSGFLAVPDAESEDVRILPVAGTGAEVARAWGTWRRTKAGYRILVSVDVGRPLQSGENLPVNLVVNEMYPDRVRRAGQLVLSGGGGWVYLRGDREHPRAAVIAEVL